MDAIIEINIRGIKYIAKAERVFINRQIEQLKISGEGVSLVLENNRPLLEDIGLNKSLTWRVIHGKLNDKEAYEQIIARLETIVKKR